jgi:serine protease
LILTTLFACGSGGGGGDDSNSVGGTIHFVAEDLSMLTEAEPNDSVDQPQPMGDLAPGRDVVIRGQVGAEGDAMDAYSFHAPSRSTVTALLLFESAERAHLGVFDPVAMQHVQSPRTGGARFVARGAFDLVVRSDRAAGRYTLRVHTTPAPAVLDRPGWIGDHVVGDALELSSQGAATWTATSAQAQDLVVNAPAGVNVRVREISRGVESSANGGEAHMDLAAMSRVEITTDVAATISITTRAPLASAVARASARLADAAEERSLWGASAAEALYGNTALEFAPGHVLVRARNGADLAADFASRNCTLRDVVPGIAVLVTAPVSASMPPEERSRATVALARSLAVSSRVEYAELDFVRRAQGTVAVTPNDPFATAQLQWHYPMIRLPQAWGVFTGATTSIVAVLDTGERPHPDLTPNLITGYDFINDSGIAGDGDGRDPDPFDEGDGQGPAPSTFHGTHVAGTIAAVTNNNAGVAGVCGPANKTRVMPLRVLGIGGGLDSDIAQAILYAAHLPNASTTLPAQRADVINMSLGGPGSNATVQSAINSAFAAGVTVFAAAGNANSGSPFFPAAYNNVISVSAVDINSAKAFYSNFNATVDVCAPGGDTTVDINGDTYPDGVLSTLVDESNGSPIYVFYQGTSMACPHAAGVAALMHSQDPALTPAQIETKLESTAVDLGAPGHDSIFGNGRIDAYAALVSAGATPLGGSPILDVLPTSIDFGDDRTQLTFQVLNDGGGALDVGLIADDAAWLTLVPVSSSDGTTNIGAVDCTVDRTGLAVGSYTATITVHANNGTVPSRTVAVMLEVVPVPVVVDVDLYVLAVDSTTFDTVKQTIVNPTTGLAYALADLPDGDYYIICGSDEDTSDGVCGPNDTYCGAYPTLDQPVPLHLDGFQVNHVNFTVAPMVSTATGTGAAQRTYRRLGP